MLLNVSNGIRLEFKIRVRGPDAKAGAVTMRSSTRFLTDVFELSFWTFAMLSVKKNGSWLCVFGDNMQFITGCLSSATTPVLRFVYVLPHRLFTVVWSIVQFSKDTCATVRFSTCGLLRMCHTMSFVSRR